MRDLFDLHGRVALVTGASSGLGRHFAGVLASAGASVVVAARRLRRLETLVEEIREAGGDAHAVQLDVTDSEVIGSAFDAAESACGPVDLLVNNAGIGAGSRVEDIPDDEWQATLATNLTAVQRLAAACARRLIAAGRPGAIVNIASILGMRTGTGTAAYGASKAAVIQLTRGQALEWARHRIRVNALCPGYFPTEMNAGFLDTPRGQAMLRNVPMRRYGELRDLDGPLLLLASDAGAFMTGTSLVVDGGHLCSSL